MNVDPWTKEISGLLNPNHSALKPFTHFRKHTCTAVKLLSCEERQTAANVTLGSTLVGIIQSP